MGPLTTPASALPGDGWDQLDYDALPEPVRQQMLRAEALALISEGRRFLGDVDALTDIGYALIGIPESARPPRHLQPKGPTMEQVTIQITGAAPMKFDAAQAQRQREETDNAVRQSFLRGAGQATPAPADGRPVVTVRELAVRLKMDRSACRRYVLALGYAPVKQRTADSGYQMALTLTAQQADEIFAKRSAEGYC